jgi:adenylosuccinate synthase
VGVGETVRHALEHPEEAIRYGDLSGRAAANKLFAIRRTLLAELEPLAAGGSEELDTLRDESVGVRWLNAARAVARHCPPADAETIAAYLTQPGCVLFEGAQGILLDEHRGFHPHTTWSSITTAAVGQVTTRFGLDVPIEHYGVLRTYPTRHGIGPFPTHDDALDARLPELHNASDNWQGRFRRGHPDAVLLRYALEAVGRLSGLLVSHLDAFDRQVQLKWCERYDRVSRLPLGRLADLTHQTELTKLLTSAVPCYASEPIAVEPEYFERLAGLTDLPVVSRSRGNTSGLVETAVA